MVALIGPRTGIHKGKHTGNQQRGCMVCHRIRSGKNSARLPVPVSYTHLGIAPVAIAIEHMGQADAAGIIQPDYPLSLIHI